MFKAREDGAKIDKIFITTGNTYPAEK